MGINAWIKPTKFFLSVWIFSWTMGWLLYYLQYAKKIRVYSWMVVIVMTFELAVIAWQAGNGRLSHFNVSTSLYGALFTAMGVAISVLTLWTGYMAYLFFRQNKFSVPMEYIWGIRIGMILFVVFSFEGGYMAARLAHTVGAPDGSPGLPFLNWSRFYGDLRVAHFFGIHSLQIIPLFANYLTKKVSQVFIFALVYLILLIVLLLQAIYRVPFIG